MQISDVPDLAHTRPHPMHWLATATAMAGVVALAGLLQPGAATASQTGSEPVNTASGGAAPPAPDPAGVEYPLECGGAGTVVVRQAVGDLDGDRNPETVVAVRCEAGSGTPPQGVYVLTAAAEGGARIVATLVGPEEKRNVGPDFEIREGVILATLLGYSGPEVPSCCPDEEERVSWRWENGAFVRALRPEARSV